MAEMEVQLNSIILVSENLKKKHKKLLTIENGTGTDRTADRKVGIIFSLFLGSLLKRH